MVIWRALELKAMGSAGSGDKRPCIVEKNAIYFDKQIVRRNLSTANSHEDCCAQCSSVYAPAASPSDELFDKSCNLWTW